MKKKLFFVSALALVTTGIAFGTEQTASADSERLSRLDIHNILNEYSSQLDWDASTYSSSFRYWMMHRAGKTANDIRRELNKALFDENYESDYY
ncbi:hypothetical protein ACVRWQ_04545 [Streptococcus phocae subsp. salmonis]|uniref:hypothetical protein n=1 Tax=Streptococcus phocae TaxID=119224 RepID=UPI000531B6A8|nr:hypothetical protein [Streptococcus phocae]KGR72460.1 hypothetical protein NX86_06305 [Streptococcus phocae subsp. salmonis]